MGSEVDRALAAHHLGSPVHWQLVNPLRAVARKRAATLRRLGNWSTG
jgi:hypothetical protein